MKCFACEERGGKIEKERLSQGALVEELELKQDMHLVWKSRYRQWERITTWCSTIHHMSKSNDSTANMEWICVWEYPTEFHSWAFPRFLYPSRRRCLGIWCFIVGWLGLVQKKGGFSWCGRMASSPFSSKPSCVRRGGRQWTDGSKAMSELSATFCHNVTYIHNMTTL